MKVVKLNARNRITVPAEARARLGIEAGDILDVSVIGDSIQYVKRPMPGDDVRKGRRDSLAR